ncbi:MAG: hypothetical protein H7X71_04215 [Chitinophagales bacterium]|nr:hypothetical protein [Chitinophagales bacterium]
MHKRISIYILTLCSCLLVFTSSCKKEITQEIIYDNIIYGVDTVAVYASANEKDRLKTPLQYISSLYSNLYFSSIPSNELDNLVIYRLSLGDKNLVNEMIVNAMLADPAVAGDLPSDEDMRSDPEDFIETTYLRFYLRTPTEYEKYGLKEIIDNDVDITVKEVYRAFLLSNEYSFY